MTYECNLNLNFRPDRDLNEEARFSDRREDISVLKFSPDGTLLAVGSHDSIVDVYSTSEYERTAVMEGASSYITHLDWSQDGKYIELNSGAGEKLTYSAAGGIGCKVSSGCGVL